MGVDTSKSELLGMRFSTTPQLKTISTWATEKKMNRQLCSDFVESIADEVLHVCSMHIIHCHRAGKLVMPHLRTFWHIALQDGSVAEMVAIDVDLDVYMDNSIKPNEEFMELWTSGDSG